MGLVEAEVGTLEKAAEAAGQDKDWRRAADLWKKCIDSNPDAPRPRWYAAQGMALLALEEFDEAETVFEAGAALFKPFPAGAVGRARCAMGKERWEQAIELWNACFENYPAAVQGNWYPGLAECLLRLDRLDEAEAALQPALDPEQKAPGAYILNARIAQRRGEWAEAAARWRAYLDAFGHKDIAGVILLECATAFYADGDDDRARAVTGRALQGRGSGGLGFRRAYVGMLARNRKLDAMMESYESGLLADKTGDKSDLVAARALVTCNRIDDARSLMHRVMPHLHDPDAIERAMPVIALAFEPDDRRALYKTLTDHAQRLLKKTPDSEILMRLRADAALGTRDLDLFRDAVAAYAAAGSERAAVYRDMLRRVENPDASESRRAKVFGIGLSKTGTTSLSDALEMLGYHAAHWANPYTYELISDRDFQLFDALTDTPISYQFERLAEVYPDAKFVYTRRPVDDWLESWEKHMLRDLDVRDFQAFLDMVNGPLPVRYGDIYREIHNRLYCAHKDARTAFLSHEERVFDFFSGDRADRLLTFDLFAGDGFDKLCGFLGVPVPDTAFPWGNAAVSKTGAIVGRTS